ncbi:hypothetical protein LC613_28700 [Nostoc sphaeroides CHAB 2801]|uniref:hypothetical protein n=1 Tax=Nostoc sphaeroides TaxID=446679 RepID=UPI000E4C5D27|nr:hypothetical protein [Nostoc sphaeroides]MCC5631700.1 hypothetical protein [Nostoc sphaeroides CHAB 2801]
MAQILDLKGTSLPSIQIEKAGVRLKNNAGDLQVKNSADSAFTKVTASIHESTSDTGLVINSDAASTGADWKITLARPTSGQTADYTLTLPTSAGSPSQVLTTNGSGVTSWTTVSGGTTNGQLVDTTALAFNSASSVSMFTLPANAVVHRVEVIIDTPWATGSATMTVGVSGTTSKYAGSNLIDLYGTAKDIYVSTPGEIANASAESLIITYAASTATAGAARVLVYYSNPG